MRKIRVATFISLDGVMQAPGGPDEDPTGGFTFGGWTTSYWDETLGSLMGQAMGEDFDLLLGRKTYEIFAAHWPYVDDEIGRKFNAITKYVAAGPDQPLDWTGTERLEGDVAEAVARLKQGAGKDLLIQGSSVLIQTLLAADLIDEITTLVFPVTLGLGKRLFGDGARARAFTLSHTRHSSTGVVVSTYQRAGDVPLGSFALETPTDAEVARRERMKREG